jgi:plastocyanin
VISRRQFLRRAVGGALGTAAVAVLAACQGNREPLPEIRMLSQNQLSPASLTIRKGTTVVWHNAGVWSQTASCDPAKQQDKTRVLLPQGAPAWDSGVLYPGQSWSYTFLFPGDYIFSSLAQNTPSMVGIIHVTE